MSAVRPLLVLAAALRAAGDRFPSDATAVVGRGGGRGTDTEYEMPLRRETLSVLPAASVTYGERLAAASACEGRGTRTMRRPLGWSRGGGRLAGCAGSRSFIDGPVEPSPTALAWWLVVCAWLAAVSVVHFAAALSRAQGRAW